MSRSEIREFVGGIASLACVFGPPVPKRPSARSLAEDLELDLLAIAADARLVSVELGQTIRGLPVEEFRAGALPAHVKAR